MEAGGAVPRHYCSAGDITGAREPLMRTLQQSIASRWSVDIQHALGCSDAVTRLQRTARRMLRSDRMGHARVQRAITYIQFQEIQRMGGISEENVKSYFGSVDDTGEALREASRKARAYLARKSDHATFLAFSGVLDVLDSRLHEAIGDDTGCTAGPTATGDADTSANTDFTSACAESLAEGKQELDHAPAPTLEQTQMVCKMFKDVQQAAQEGVRRERELIDADYRARLRKALGTGQSPLTAHGLNTARVLNTRILSGRKRASAETEASSPAKAPAPHFDVSTRPGIQSPVHLQNVTACKADGSHAVALRCALLGDTGSGTCLLGEADFKVLQAAGLARRVRRLSTSVEQIAGIGAVNLVLFHASFHLNFGGAVVTFSDVPVLAGHEGILLGNDFHRTTRTVYDFDECQDQQGSVRDGYIVLRDGDRLPVSDPIFFSHAPESGRTATTSLADSAVPVAFNPEALRVPKWCEALIRVRVPAAALGDHPILVLPLDDDRLKSLPVLVSAGIYKPDPQGFVHLRVINATQQTVRIAQLSAIARFIIDPSIKDADLEFTSDEIIESVQTQPGCTHLMREDILHMLQTRRRLFASKLGWAHGYQHSLDIGPDAIPPNIPPRRLAPQEYVALKEAVDKQMKAGLLEYCSSPFNARPMMVPKLTGGYRTVLDYRRLNELVLKAGSGCSYPLPRVDDNLNSLAKAKWFTAVDLLSGFHQIEMVDGLRGKLATAFSTPWGQMCYTRMPMGLTSSPGAFMSVVDAALRGLPQGIAVAYVDDILIPTDGEWHDHLRDVGLVFDRLIAAGFTVNPKKVFIGMREVPYLGYLVGAYGTRPNPERTKAIFDMSFEQIRTDAAAAARFSGMISFYSRFLKNLHITLAPFHALKAKHANVHEILNSLKLRASFEVLRNQLADVTALTRPDYSKDFHVVVDTASSVGMGATLMQLEDVSDPTSLRPVAFWSHRLNENERGWPVRDQECYGLVCALREWRPYVLGTHTHVKTDHKSLKWLMTTNHSSGSRVQHWVADIQQYDLDIDYIPGPENVVADCLSRAMVNCLRVVLDDSSGHTCFSSVGEETGENAAKVFKAAAAGKLNGPMGRPATRVVPDRVALLLLDSTCSKALVVSSNTNLDEYSFPSCRYPADTCMSYRDAVGRILQETPVTSSFKQLTHIQSAALQFRSQASTENGKRTYFYAHRLTQSLELACAESSSTRWVDMTNAQLHSLHMGDDDLAFGLNVIAHRDGVTRPNTFWRAHNYRKLLATQIAQTATAVASQGVDVLPRFSTGHTIDKDGSIFCDTLEDAKVAVDRHIRPDTEEEGILAVDLEGSLSGAQPHVALLQAGTRHSVFVFDTHVAPAILAHHGCGLREVLNDSSIVKVLHSCHGDSYALRTEHQLVLSNVFDTAIADAILTNRHPGSSRGLGPVLVDWLGDDVVHLTHKGKLVHVPYMFNVRPLTLEHYVYSAEDVEYCVQLYCKMRAALEEHGFLELAQTLSSDRCQPLAPMYVYNPRLTFVVVDAAWVLCLKCKASGVHEFPVCEQAFDVARLEAPIADLKSFMSTEWAALMGPAPSAGRFTTYISSHMRKPRRLGHFLMACCIYPSLISIYAELKLAFAKSPLSDSHCLTLRPRERASTSFLPSHRVLMQNVRLWTTLGIALPSRNATTSKLRSAKLTRRSAAIILQRALRARECRVPTRARTNIALGRQLTPIFAALVVHDGTHAFVVSGATASAPWFFPSSAVAVGASPFDAAVQAFDKYAGPAARKGVSSPAGVEQTALEDEKSWQLLPRLSQLMRDGLEAGSPLGHYGPTTTFFSCYVPGLADYASSIYASRNDFNGFRLTPTEMRKHPHAGIVTLPAVLARLATADAAALKASIAQRNAPLPVPASPSHTAVSQYALALDGFASNRAFKALTVQKFERLVGEYNEVQRAAVCLQGRPLRISDLIGYTHGGLDSLAAAVQEEFAKTYDDACHSGHEKELAQGCTGHTAEEPDPSCHSGSSSVAEPSTPRYMAGEPALDIGDLPLPRVPQPPPDSSTAAGSADQYKMPRLEDLIEAQRQHPATAAYFAFHISGTMPADLTPREAREFKDDVALNIAMEDGTAYERTRSPGKRMASASRRERSCPWEGP